MKKICIVLALLYAPVAGAEYKCVDGRGLTHVGDTLMDFDDTAAVVARLEADARAGDRSVPRGGPQEPTAHHRGRRWPGR